MDKEFKIKEKQARRSNYNTVELPRDPLGSLDVTGALDMSSISNRTAMQVFSSVLKSARKDFLLSAQLKLLPSRASQAHSDALHISNLMTQGMPDGGLAKMEGCHFKHRVLKAQKKGR